MERIAMSQVERDWLDWLKRARDGKITQRQAAERMGVSQRWVRKLLRRMKREGDLVVVHGLRGKPSNSKLPEQPRGWGRASRNGCWKCMPGARGEADSASWCNGTPRSTTGWKGEGRCGTWCA